MDGGRSKADAAAEMISKIFPGSAPKSANFSVPMPGHLISRDERKGVAEVYAQLEALIKE